MRTLASILFALLFGDSFGATILVANYGTGTAAKANFDLAYAAASAGDTIQFPSSGSATWTTGATIGKAVTIDGNGTTLTAGGALATGFFYVTGFTSTSLMRITGFTFNLVDLTANRHALYIMSIDLTQLRVDHNTFNHGDIQVEVGGSFGVFDHNNFYNGRSSVYFTAGSRAQADASWASMAAGTSSALYFEDNLFHHNGSWLGANENNSHFDTYNGGKLVIRYNTFTATNLPPSWTGPLGVILTHGSAAGGAAVAYWQADANARRGQSVVEIHNNTVYAPRVDFLAQIRGSANLVYSNILDTATFNPRVYLYEEEQDGGQWSPARTAWPAEDQVHNSFFWANTLRLNDVANSSYVDVGASSASYIQLDRDYFMHAPQATGGSESFTGANGAAGTDPTDGSPYATSGTMVFTSSGANAYYGYTPYTYPHPLTVDGGSGGGGTSTAPGHIGVSHRGGVRIK